MRRNDIRYFLKKEIEVGYRDYGLVICEEAFLRGGSFPLEQIKNETKSRILADLEWVKERNFYEYEVEINMADGRRLVNV